MNEKIKVALVEGKGMGNVKVGGGGGGKRKESGEDEWVDEVEDEGMVDGGEAAEGVEAMGQKVGETGKVHFPGDSSVDVDEVLREGDVLLYSGGGVHGGMAG